MGLGLALAADEVEVSRIWLDFFTSSDSCDFETATLMDLVSGFERDDAPDTSGVESAGGCSFFAITGVSLESLDAARPGRRHFDGSSAHSSR